MPAIDPNERRLAAQIAANTSWANTPDRAARTAAARAALDERFLAEANGNPAAAKNLRKAYFQRLALASAKARRRDREHAEAVAELAALTAEIEIVRG